MTKSDTLDQWEVAATKDTFPGHDKVVEYRDVRSERILALIELVRKKDEFLKMKSKRSSYQWSERGPEPYMPGDYVNEGEIKCALEALALTEQLK